MVLHFTAQHAEAAELVYHQINSVTNLLDYFNTRKEGLNSEPERRGETVVETKPTKILRLISPRSDSSMEILPLRQPTLPIEILDHILSSVQSQSDLLNVAISNRHMNAVAVRTIYQTVILAKPAESIKCLQTLSQHPRLAKLVRSLGLHWQNFNYPSRNLYSLALRALCNTSLLHTLSVDIPPEFHPWNLSACSFQLKKFSASFPCDNSLIKFLENQPSLLDLTLRGFSPDPPEFSFNLSTFNLRPNPLPFPLSPGALPRLSRLRAIHAGPDVIESVIKGRPVKQVSMPLYADCIAKSLDALTLSTETIERLNIISFDPDAPVYLLDEIASRLPDLEALHIVILLAQCSEALLEALAPSLKKFKSLQYLTYMSATSTDTVSNEDEQSIAAKWHQCCPTLKTIILPMGRVWFLDNTKWLCLEDSA